MSRPARRSRRGDGRTAAVSGGGFLAIGRALPARRGDRFHGGARKPGQCGRAQTPGTGRGRLDRGGARVSVRALVVRSGENPFPFAPGPLPVEIVEKVSHSIEPLQEGVEQLDSPADLAIFTSQVAVRRLSEEPGLLDRFRKAISGGRIAAVGAATAAALGKE